MAVDVAVPFGDAEAVAGAITPRTVAVLVEPVQGEAGVFVPPAGYLAAIRRICTDSRVLFLADEIQSGLGRCGTTFACEREDVVPDVYLLGKALGGGIVPLSAVVSRNDVLGVITPGSHGSTFGGNPLAVAVGHAVIGLLETGEFQERARVLGKRLRSRLEPLVGSRGITVDHHRGAARLDAGSVRDRARRRDGCRLTQASSGTRNDHAIKNDNTPVTQMAVTPVSTSPPASGSAHFGESSRVRINILKTKAP